MYRKERNKVLIIEKGISLILIRSHSHSYTEFFDFFIKSWVLIRVKVTLIKIKYLYFIIHYLLLGYYNKKDRIDNYRKSILIYNKKLISKKS